MISGEIKVFEFIFNLCTTKIVLDLKSKHKYVHTYIMFTTPCACGRIPGAFCSPLFVHADLRNFNAVRRTQFYDLIQIVALISLRIVRAIRGTNSHHDKLKM